MWLLLLLLLLLLLCWDSVSTCCRWLKPVTSLWADTKSFKPVDRFSTSTAWLCGWWFIVTHTRCPCGYTTHASRPANCAKQSPSRRPMPIVVCGKPGTSRGWEDIYSSPSTHYHLGPNCRADTTLISSRQIVRCRWTTTADRWVLSAANCSGKRHKSGDCSTSIMFLLARPTSEVNQLIIMCWLLMTPSLTVAYTHGV